MHTLKADITVLRSRDDEATKSLLKTHLQDVQMVWVAVTSCAPVRRSSTRSSWVRV